MESERIHEQGRTMRTVAVLLSLALVACARSDAPRMQNADTLTQRQRDSVVGASKLPGAQGISKAQKAQDAENARTAKADSMARADSI